MGIGGAHPLNLAALDRKQHVLRAFVSLHQPEFGAEHVVEDGRKNAVRRGGAGAADDELAREQVGHRLHRRRVPNGADAARKRGRAEPVEVARIGLDVCLPHQLLIGDVARERPDHAPVRRRLAVNIIGRRDAGGPDHVLDDDRRLSGNVFRQVFREQPRADVVVVADLVAGDQAHLPVAVEILRLLRIGRGDAAGEHGRDGQRRPELASLLDTTTLSTMKTAGRRIRRLAALVRFDPDATASARRDRPPP